MEHLRSRIGLVQQIYQTSSQRSLSLEKHPLNNSLGTLIQYTNYYYYYYQIGLDLVTKMIELDPAKRIYVKEAMKHPFFDDLNREDLIKYFPVGQEKLALQYGR